MDKIKQRELTRWLKQQSASAKPWLRLLMLLGFLHGLIIVSQAWILASILHSLIIENTARDALQTYFALLILTVILKTVLAWAREKVGFLFGASIRRQIRGIVLDRLERLGPAWIQGKPAGSWATMILEQIEDMQDYYARYLPQMALAGIIPVLVLATVYPINWAAGLILTVTAPLIPLFMALVGLGAADANRRNFLALSRLSGSFLDRLRGLDTLRLFHRAKAETKDMQNASNDLRMRTMDVLRLAFLSSAVLEFFTSVSIAVVAVYFGFSYLGELTFGSYGLEVSLFAGFLVLILAPEFFQPLRDLGTFYHAKAQAIGAAESLIVFMNDSSEIRKTGEKILNTDGDITLLARDLVILSSDGKVLAGPLNFMITPGERIALVGHSGAGKSSLLNVLLGFLPYQGSLTINNLELRDIQPQSWRNHISWVGQNPHLPEQTIRENILLAKPDASEQQLLSAAERAFVSEFMHLLPNGLDTVIGDSAARLSVGQAQRVAVARALLIPNRLLLLDEPTASLDATSERLVMQALNQASMHQTSVLVTHRLADAINYSTIWVMDNGALVQSGTFEQLSQIDGPFQQLMSNQGKEI